MGVSLPARLRESVCEKKKTTIRTKRELTTKKNKKGTGYQAEQKGNWLPSRTKHTDISKRKREKEWYQR
jgi:hypothetical protein